MDGQATSGKKNPVSGDSGTLAQEIMSEYAPTMRKLGMLPTPLASNYKGGRTSEALILSGRKKNNSLPDYFNQAGKTFQINPLFVEEMMGYPPNWTALPFQNGELKQ
jgi:hypothetical protein